VFLYPIEDDVGRGSNAFSQPLKYQLTIELASMASEGKQAEEKSDHDEFDILKKVARFFQRKRDDNAMYGGDKNGGLESVFEDFCDSHADEFVTEMVGFETSVVSRN